MSKTIIPSDKNQERRMANPGKNEVFVGSRQGGKSEHIATKEASIKHHNPEYFKRQSDRKNYDRGQLNKAPHEAALQHAKAAEKDIKFLEKHERETLSGKSDQFPSQIKQFSKGTIY